MEKCDCIKTGLVLEGGGLRSIYTAAVLDVLMEQGISVDELVGVSAGALFGVNYLSKQKGRVLRYNKKYNTDKDYMGLRPLLREGNIMNTKYAYHDVPFELDPFDNEAYRKSGVPFFAVLTDVKTAKPEYVRIYDVFLQMDLLRASGSMPFVSKDVEILGRSYLDGGITDSIPYQFMLKDRKMDKVIVILTRDKSYRKKPMAELPLRIYGKKHPALAEALRQRHEMYNREIQELEELEREGKAFIIRPTEPIKIGRLEKDPEKIQGVYDLGIRDMQEYLPKLREFLSPKNPLVEKIAAQLLELSEGKEQVIVAMDGRCAAGKTTLSEALKQRLKCNVFHMDDFFLRPEQRSDARYQEAGGNVDYERFTEEVMLPLQEKRAFEYRPFSCKTMSFKEPVSVSPKKIVIVEGAYSCHPKLWDFYDFRFFVSIDREEQIRRIRERNGEERLPMFLNKWIPLEEKYFSAYHLEEKCDELIRIETEAE